MTEENKYLLTILKNSLWEDAKQANEIPDNIRRELCSQTVEGLTAIAYSDTQNLKYSQTSWFAKMIHMQSEAIEQLRCAGILVVVIKGTAAGIYYPQPALRTYGDIDLMVKPEQYQEAIKVLRKNEWRQNGSIGDFHTEFHKNDECLELHQCSWNPKNNKEIRYIYQFLLSGFDDIQDGVIEQAQCHFSMFPWQQNGLELIWHFRVHLYNGIGLRHAIDWMMFVNACLDDDAYQQFKSVLEQAGLLTLAKTVTRMCQLYLGLTDENITWCADAEPSLCAGLMEFIFEQGNFGNKRPDDKAAKVLTRYRNPLEFLRGMQNKGLREWTAAQKFPILRPFAWLRVGIEGATMFITPSGRAKLKKALIESNQRKELFDQLYGDRSK